jgi:hypothetical protein
MALHIEMGNLKNISARYWNVLVVKIMIDTIIFKGGMWKKVASAILNPQYATVVKSYLRSIYFPYSPLAYKAIN